MNERPRNISGEMNEKESLEAFIEGAKRAASAARELASECNDPDWIETADMLDAIRASGTKLAGMKAMARFETAMAIGMKTKQFIPG